MTTIANYNAAVSSQLPATAPPRVSEIHAKSQSQGELRERFTQFVGEAFFGQMIKAMRSTVGKPAYFHGGRAEEVFQGQLDQALAEHLTEASASRFAEPMFERQFPHLAKQASPNDLSQLMQLRRA
jgi:hypothetical protein